MKQLPNHCVCGYRMHIERLEAELALWKKIADTLVFADHERGVDLYQQAALND